MWRAFDLAAEHYRSAAELGGSLRAEALRSAEICEEIYAALQLGFALQDTLNSFASARTRRSGVMLAYSISA